MDIYSMEDPKVIRMTVVNVNGDDDGIVCSLDADTWTSPRVSS